MKPNDLLLESFDRIRDRVHSVVQGLDVEQLAYRPAADANSIAWLVWHLTRIQDDHVSALAGDDQAWFTEGWAERFALPFEPDATGYGQSPEEVGAVRADAAALAGYHDAVDAATRRFLATIDEDALDAVVDRSWDPPVTAGVRLVSVVSDALQHVGQAAYLRGLLP